MVASRTCSNSADLRNVGILIMLIWVIKISKVRGICSEPDIDAQPTDSKCARPLIKMRLCGTRTPTVCAMPQNVTQVFHKYGTQGASKVMELNTVERCVHGCVTNSSCHAVDWNTKHKECWFHGNGTFCNTRKVKYNVDHYKMQKCSSGWRCSKECRYGSCLFLNQRCKCHVGYTGDTCSSAIDKTCLNPGNGENTTAHLQSQAYSIGDVKQYTCSQGHVLENNSTSKALLCQIDGTWNDTAAVCKAGHCTPPDVGNNATSSKVPPYHVHQHVDFECRIGHVFPDGNSVKTITCTTNLTFNASIPNCSRVRCQLYECFTTSGQTSGRMTGQPENIAAISAGSGTAAVVVILVLLGIGLVFWRRRSKEKKDSSRDHKNQPPPSHRPSNVNNDTQDVSETGFSYAAVSSPNASDDIKLHTKAKEQGSTIADLCAVPERKKKAKACRASDTAGDSVQNPGDLYAVPERKKKTNAPPNAIQGTSEADSDDYQLATHFGDDVSDDDMQMVENDLYEDSDGRITDVTGVGEPPSEGVVFRENSIYGS